MKKRNVLALALALVMSVGMSSSVFAAYLVKQGYTNVHRYGGGISAWVDAGYDVEKVETPAAQ